MILAGGESSRMGEDKALLSLGQQTLLERTADSAATVTDELWLNRKPEQKIPPALSQHKVIYDAHKNQGPLAGIYSAITYALDNTTYTGLLVIPVDLPFIDQKTLLQLIQKGTKNTVPACYGKHFLPLYLPLSKELREYVEQQLDNDNSRKSVASVFYQFNGISLPVPDDISLTNTNTLDEWNFARKKWETHNG